ncbi:Peptidyl-prolyl cis-trans isomerase FKBP9 [Holothuria leucospilota]|uniref:peptidylprolyl isomerase n=1 Tax=Holothuria leucospilota TaxID=206669 RepID=A0A9Q1C2V4_HOLLE|nr:Peptidyl-prolyl cis-trans isomerase FKBP9 [Holothuria leucospilota]
MNWVSTVTVCLLVFMMECGHCGKIYEAKRDPRVKYEILKESPNCRAKLAKTYQGWMDFVGRYQDTNETFINSTTLGQEVRKRNEEVGDTIGFPMDYDYLFLGLEIGLEGQCRHETRRIWIPKELVTGGQKIFSPEYIPRGRDLVFDIVLWNVAANYMIGMPNMFKVYDKDKDGYITKKEAGEYITETEKYPSGPLVTKLVNEFIERDDMDGDKRVSFDEFSGPKYDSDGTRHEEL